MLQVFEESAEGQLLQRMRAIEREHREASATHFNFIVARHVRTCSMTRLPRLQDLSATHPDWIVRMSVDMTSAVLGHYRGNILAVSHRWETSQEPDSRGAQLAALKQFLEEHATIEYVWMDFPCMPQAKRTEAEKIEFDEMLRHVNALYLGMRVLILLDISSFSRFWTQLEAWMSMQDFNAETDIRRFTIVPLHSARDSEAKRLVEMWSGTSAQAAHDQLSLPDVMVTNESDKTLHLPKIQKLCDTVAEHLKAHNIIDCALQQLAHAVVAGSDRASPERAMARARTAGVWEKSLQEAQAFFG